MINPNKWGFDKAKLDSTLSQGANTVSRLPKNRGNQKLVIRPMWELVLSQLNGRFPAESLFRDAIPDDDAQLEKVEECKNRLSDFMTFWPGYSCRLTAALERVEIDMFGMVLKTGDVFVLYGDQGSWQHYTISAKRMKMMLKGQI